MQQMSYFVLHYFTWDCFFFIIISQITQKFKKYVLNYQSNKNPIKITNTFQRVNWDKLPT